MKALVFDTSVPRYLATSAIARLYPQVLLSKFSPTQLREIPEPVLKGDDWVKIRPRLSGLCGTDMGIVLCRQSTTLEPFAAYPMILGHEVSGEREGSRRNTVGDIGTIRAGGSIPSGLPRRATLPDVVFEVSHVIVLRQSS